jgi:F420-dependent oxidoreductase-like protein
MRVAINMPRHSQARETAQWAREMEAASVDVIWVGEAYSFDAVSMLGYLAGQTSKIELGSSILQTYSRSPAMLGMTAAGLDYVSDGRFLLGLGSSGPSVVEAWHGIPYEQPLARTREIVDICRAIWRRDRLEVEGKVFTVPRRTGPYADSLRPIKMIDHPVRSRIPIYLAALGRRSVAMAAEIAEGWYPLFFDPARVDLWRASLDDGLARRDESLGGLEIVAGGWAAFCNADQAKEIRDLERPHVALYVGAMGPVGNNFYNDLFVEYGFEQEAAEIERLYRNGDRAGAEAIVPEDYLISTSLVGEPEQVRERVHAFRDAGVTCLRVELPEGYDRPAELVAKLKEWAED